MNTASPWILVSFLLAALLHNVSSQLKIQEQLGTKSIKAQLKVTLLGMLLPICDCGTVPLGISMYYSGAYLGPVLNFVTATPMINPASVVLFYGLLGPELTLIYVIAGFVIPMIVGIVANQLAGDELCADTNPKLSGRIIKATEQKMSCKERILDGFAWVLQDFGVTVSKFTVLGVLMAAFITVVIPDHIIQQLLGQPTMLSIGVISFMAALMFVCAIGHIPFVGALVAAGASPGVAITFLMIGSATNITENINLYHMIGKRAMLLNLVQLVLYGIFLGWLTNKLLMPGFAPAIGIDRASGSIDFANRAILLFPAWVEWIASLIVIALCIKALIPIVMNKVDDIRERMENS